MSFSSDVKNELAVVKPEKDCCFISEIGGMFATMGSLSLLGRGKVNVQFTSESLAACRRAFTLLSHHLSITPQIHYVTSARFGGTRKCVLTLGPVHSPILLKALHMMDESGSLRYTEPHLGLTRQCCMRAFLRGVMLGGGTMSSPEQSYHLELPCRDSDVQAMMAKCVQRIGLPIRLGVRREQHTYLYFKQSDQIVTFLTAIGAHQSVMSIEDLRVKRQVMGTINRAMNCDNANLQKQMDASAMQAEAIRRLNDSGKLQSLPLSLQQVAIARMNNPGASLQELGEMLDPPIGKSGVNHRMRRLMTYLDNETNPQHIEEEQP